MKAVSKRTTNDELCALSGRLLAQKIRQGEVSALDVVEAHIGRIEAVNPRLNAVVVRRYDEARAEAREVESAAPPVGRSALLAAYRSRSRSRWTWQGRLRRSGFRRGSRFLPKATTNT